MTAIHALEERIHKLDQRERAQIAGSKAEPFAPAKVIHLDVSAPNPVFPGFAGIVSIDPAMQPVFDIIKRVAPTNEPVLITGESGTGKELVARAIHMLSQRSSKPLVTLNCSALSRDLVESELFGHMKGAFTGAEFQRRGLFEEANTGTLLLDELTELEAANQAKLLRVLENGEVRPVGANVPLRVDTRILAATNKCLSKLVGQGLFREDLFYRIHVIEIAIPPLRARPADIELLSKYFLSVHAPGRAIEPEGFKRLKDYHFPGNVRELKNIVHRAAILCPHQRIGPEYLSFPAMKIGRSERRSVSLEAAERDAIVSALEETQWNQSLASEILGIARSTLKLKIRKLGIRTPKEIWDAASAVD